MFLVAHAQHAVGDVVQISGNTASALINDGICAFANAEAVEPQATEAAGELPTGSEDAPLALADEALKAIALARGLLVGSKEEFEGAIAVTVEERDNLLEDLRQAGETIGKLRLDLSEANDLSEHKDDELKRASETIADLRGKLSASLAAPTPEPVPVFSVPGLPHQAVDALKAAGLWSEEALRKATDAELIALNGVAEGSVKKIRAAFPPES